MHTFHRILVFFLLSACGLPQKQIVSSPAQEANPNFFAFIGEKISLRKGKSGGTWIVPDEGFYAKYRVIKPIYGELKANEIIEFRAFDHYGFPPFGRFSNVLLFVSKRNGELIHEKYLYHRVHPTKDGRWAECGEPKFRFPKNYPETIPLEEIHFEPEVSFEITPEMTEEEIQEAYPSDSFSLTEDSAICRKGRYADDLFLFEKNGVLRAREIFLQ